MPWKETQIFFKWIKFKHIKTIFTIERESKDYLVNIENNTSILAMELLVQKEIYLYISLKISKKCILI
jgi:hypothetical protein